MPITILIADDHPLFRQGLRMVISAEPDFQIIAEAGDGEEALEQIISLSPTVAILDIDMPKRDGFAVVRELNRLCSTAQRPRQARPESGKEPLDLRGARLRPRPFCASSLTVGMIFLTAHTGVDLLEDALEIGVRGYLLKSWVAIDLAEGIRRVASGNTYFSPEVHEMLQRKVQDRPRPRNSQP